MFRYILAIVLTASVAHAQRSSFGGGTASALGDPITFTATPGTINGAGVIELSPAGDANRLFSFSASSDTVLKLNFGDGTASQDFAILGTTSDGSDTQQLELGAATAISATRTGYIQLQGADFGGAQAGDVTIGSPDDFFVTTGSGGATRLTILDTGATTISGALTINASADTNRVFNFTSSSDTALTWNFGDAGSTSAQELHIKSRTLNTDDDTVLFLCAADTCGDDGRSAWLQITGADSDGTLYLNSADGVTNDVNISATDDFIVEQGGGTDVFALDTTTGDAWLTGDLTIGGAIAALDADVTAVSGAGYVFGILDDSASAGAEAVVQATNDGTGFERYFFKTRNTSGSANTVVQSGDNIGTIYFYGADGADYKNAASISADVDAGAGSNDMPGRLVFKTTTDAGSTLSTRLTINNAGDSTFTGDVILNTTGQTVAIDSGTAASACAGTGTHNGTTPVTISTTCAATGARIFFVDTSEPTATSGCWVTNIVNGTSFDVDCKAASQDATFAWWITKEG